MASTSTASALPNKRSLNVEELRKKVFVGELPADFLRLASFSGEAAYIPQQADAQLPLPPQPQQQLHGYPVTPAQHFYSFVPANTRGRIAVKIVEAKLTKNYGLLRMDLYARLRIGNTVFETPTSISSGKAPSWNRVINAYLPEGVESIYLQIFDERSFTNDECIAWSHIMLPEGIFSNENIDEWYPLSGQQGEGKEGVVNLVMSFSPVEAAHPQVAPGPETVQAPQQLYTEEELNELQAMFPNVDKEVIRSVLEMKRGDKDGTVTALIEMSS
jgi:toll-interacting protein